MRHLGGLLRDLFGVLVDGARLLVRHWPVLVALAFLGAALRGGALWAAVEVSDHVSWLGRGILVFAPLGMLLPFVAMLHRVQDDLPFLRRAAATQAPPDATTGRPRRLVDVATSVLVPFLAVYVGYGLLSADFDQFLNEAGADEFNQVDLYGTGKGPDYSRVFINSWELIVALVVVAWVLRFALARVERRWRFLGLAIVGALVEVYWTGNVAGFVDRQTPEVKGWLDDRRLVHWTTQRYDDVVDRLGPLAHPVDTVTGWVFSVLGSFDAIVVVPLAWITLSAVVLGHKLASPPTFEHPWLDRVKVVPGPVGKAGGALLDDVRSRFSAFFDGLRLMARAGLLPMLLFGLAFLVALRVPYLVSVVWRRIAGPGPSDTFVAFAPIEDAVGSSLSLVVLSVLLAAATDRMLRAAAPQAGRTEAAATTASPT